MERISRRVASLTESQTLAISTRAKQMRAEGYEVISFGAGEPDFSTPEPIVEAAARAVRNPRFHRYSPAAGLPELREAIAKKTIRDSGFEVDAGQVVVTNGAKHAILVAFLTLLDPGDEVLLPTPYWVSYPESIHLAGGEPVLVSTTTESSFKVTVEQLEAARTNRTKMLVFVSPSNPTGTVYLPGEIRAIAEWAAEHDIWVLTDEIYEHFVYEDTPYASMPGLVPAIRDRCVVVNAVSKAYAMTGWRVGWLVAPGDVATGAIRVMSHSTSNVANVSQAAALAAVEGAIGPVEAMRDAYARRRRMMLDRLATIPGVRVSPPLGAFYAFPSFEAHLGTSIAGKPVHTSVDLAQVLLEEALVATVPGEAFGAPGHLRLSYALSERDLEVGMERLRVLFGV